MRRSTFIALVAGVLAGLGVQLALAQPVDPLNVKFRNATVTNSVAIGNDLTVGDDLTVTDAFAAKTIATPWLDAGVLSVVAPTAVECVAGFDSPDNTTVAICLDRLGGLAISGTKPYIGWNTGNGAMYISNGGGALNLTSSVAGINLNNDTALASGAALKINNKSDVNTAPTVTACSGGTAATITASNGTGAFQFDVGTACTGESTAVITLPAATTGWVCSCSVTTADRMLIQRTMPTSSTTTVTMQHIVISTGANGDFTDSADVACLCRGI